MTLEKPAGSTSKLGRYELLKEQPGIGAGSVWTARTSGDTSDAPSLFSVVRVNKNLTKKPETTDTFLADTRPATTFAHPTAVALVETGSEGGELYTVSAHHQGESLAALTAAAGAQGLPRPVLFRIVLDVLDALTAARAHDPPLAHGELGPQNVLVGDDGVARVAGLGYARSLSTLGPPLGAKNHDRLSYAAPERVRNMSSSSAAAPPLAPTADVFSAGVILWEGLAKQRLFTSKIEAAIVQKVLTAPIAALSSLPGVDVPAPLDAAVQKALERDPAKRTQSAAELASVIEALGAGEIASASDVAAEVEKLAGKAIAARKAEIRTELGRRAGKGSSTIPPPAPAKTGAMPRKATLLGVVPAPKPADKAEPKAEPKMPAPKPAIAPPPPAEPVQKLALAPPPEPRETVESLNLGEIEVANPTSPPPPPPAPPKAPPKAPPAKAPAAPAAAKPSAAKPPAKPPLKPAAPAAPAEAKPAEAAAAPDEAKPAEAAAAPPEASPAPAAAKPATPAAPAAKPAAAALGVRAPKKTLLMGSAAPTPPAEASPAPPAETGPKPASAQALLETASKAPSAAPPPSDGPSPISKPDGPSPSPASRGAPLSKGGSGEKFGPGSTLGRYEILMPVARGGMAAVWAAKLPGSRGFQKIFAIKTMLPDVSDDPEFENMFLDEGRVAARIRHPNVTEIIDLGEQDDVLYLVMEWVEGENLGALSKAARSLGGVPIPIILRIASQICSGLHAAHELRDDDGKLLDLVHRDISPANVLVSTSGFVKIVDFGIAKSKGRLHVTRVAGTVKGKTPYLSPEQIGQLPVDRRSDIFSLGALLYVLATGLHPFRGETDVKTMENIALREPVPLRALVNTIPAELEAVILKALSKTPADRYATAGEMQRALDQVAATLGVSTTEEDVAGFVRKALGDTLAKRAQELRAAIDRAEGRTPAPSDAEAPTASTHDAKPAEQPVVPLEIDVTAPPVPSALAGTPASDDISFDGVEQVPSPQKLGVGLPRPKNPDAVTLPNITPTPGVIEAAATPPAPREASLSRPAVPSDPDGAPLEVEGFPRKRKPVAIIAISAALGLCVLIVGVALFSGGGGKKAPGPAAGGDTATATAVAPASTGAPAPQETAAAPAATTAAPAATTAAPAATPAETATAEPAPATTPTPAVNTPKGKGTSKSPGTTTTTKPPKPPKTKKPYNPATL